MTSPDYLTFCDRRSMSTLSSKFPSCIRYASGKFSGKQRISLFTNFPLHVNKGKLVDKEIFCLPLNFPIIIVMPVFPYFGFALESMDACTTMHLPVGVTFIT